MISNSNTYIFILGTNPTLSLAEINSVLPDASYEWPKDNLLLVKTNSALRADELIKRLGGTIKISQLITEIKAYAESKILEKMLTALPQTNDKKFLFGISDYSHKLNILKLGLELKKKLKAQGIKSRLVTSSEKTLSSVVVTQNKLTGPGIEFILVKDQNKTILAKTLAVQAFKELSKRDYGRPARDSHSGMLPPKVAQIMINLSQAKPEGKILDPFCGSGTILSEAAFMGYTTIIGSDNSKKAINDTKKNIAWIKDNFDIRNSKFEFFQHDATKLSRKIEQNSIDAIITEPFLGPQRGRIDYNKTRKELNDLYTQTLQEFKKIIKAGGRIVMIWPIFRNKNIEVRLSPVIKGFKIINPTPKSLQKNKAIKLTNRNTIIYGRVGQRVWREIVTLEKK